MLSSMLLKTHFTAHDPCLVLGGKPWACLRCKSTFTRRFNALNHVKEKHPQANPESSISEVEVKNTGTGTSMKYIV